jgi:hypothetical protein
MSRFTRILAILFAGLLSCMSLVTVQADETSSTVINPVTQESTTTTVNTDTNQTTVTQVNPVTQETTTTVINTPTPSPQEATVIPQGYSNCFTVAAGWYKNVWVPEHRVCQYTQASGASGVAWVDGHWVCTKYKASEGACIKWEWKAGRWVKQLEVY